MKEIPPLHEMKDWVDYDVAHFAIGRSLGVFAQDWHDTPNIGALFYTSNVLSDSLARIADELVKIGYLEYDPSGQKYRLKHGFDGVDFTQRFL